MQNKKPLTQRDLTELPYMTARLEDFAQDFPSPDMTRRLFTTLKNPQFPEHDHPIIYIGDLIAYTKSALLTRPDFGKKSLALIEDHILKPRGLAMGTPVDHPKENLHVWVHGVLKEAEILRREAGVTPEQSYQAPEKQIEREYRTDAEIVASVGYRLSDPEFRRRQIALLKEFPEIK